MTAAASPRSYLLAITGAVVTADVLRWAIVAARDESKGPLSVHSLSLYIQVVATVAFLAAVVVMLAKDDGHHPTARRRLSTIGALGSTTVVITIGAVSLSIYARGASSYLLLAQSFALYVAINLVFTFWYWHVDAMHDNADERDDGIPDAGIQFPEETLSLIVSGQVIWRPRLIDYAFFTLMSSTSLGAPEGHMLVGSKLKALHIIHTMFILFLFVILLARAVNTLD